MIVGWVLFALLVLPTLFSLAGVIAGVPTDRRRPW